jgi:hypothetical protein
MEKKCGFLWLISVQKTSRHVIIFCARLPTTFIDRRRVRNPASLLAGHGQSRIDVMAAVSRMSLKCSKLNVVFDPYDQNDASVAVKL